MKHSLRHHPVTTLLVALRQEEVERRLGHPVTIGDVLLEPDLVGRPWLDVPEEAEVDDSAGVDRCGDGSI